MEEPPPGFADNPLQQEHEFMVQQFYEEQRQQQLALIWWQQLLQSEWCMAQQMWQPDQVQQVPVNVAAMQLPPAQHLAI